MTNSEKPNKEIKDPLGNIGLAFSGGGFRAAGYALGVLSYLDSLMPYGDNVPMLRNVKYISSTSGGTITSAAYALSASKGEDFGEFYKNMFENLSGTDLLVKVFKILNDDKYWRRRKGDKSLKRRNLINAFAIAYDELILDGGLLGDLVDEEGNSHLEEVCFNATEFYQGLLFRQSIDVKKNESEKLFLEDDYFYGFGNSFINFKNKEEVTGKLRLSDILAASSCFPAGFEPIIFPDDFTYNDDRKSKRPGLGKDELLSSVKIKLKEPKRTELERLFGKEKTQEILEEIIRAEIIAGEDNENSEQIEQKAAPMIEDLIKAFNVRKDSNDENRLINLSPNFKFGIMDGGLTDNPSIDSITNAQRRRVMNKEKGGDFMPFDMMLINDVSSHFMEEPFPSSSGYKKTEADKTASESQAKSEEEKPEKEKKRSTYTGVQDINVQDLFKILWIYMGLGITGILIGFSVSFTNKLFGFVSVAYPLLVIYAITGIASLILLNSFLKTKNILRIVLWALLGVYLFILTFGINKYEVPHKLMLFLSTIVTVISGSLLGLMLFIRYFITKEIKKISSVNFQTNFSEDIVSDFFDFFKATPIGVIAEMLKDRFDSMMTLNTEVFMKRIRYLLYDKEYTKKLHEKVYNLEGESLVVENRKIKSNYIYEFTFSNELRLNEREKKSYHGIPITDISEKMKKVAQIAFQMGTTLWFDKANQREHAKAAIIACGQFTTCLNMQEFVNRIKWKIETESPDFVHVSDEYKRKIIQLEEELRCQYDMFNADPFFLYNEMGERHQPAGFRPIGEEEWKEMEKSLHLSHFKGLRFV